MKQLKSKDIPELREKILKEDQNGLCPICNQEPKRPCLDHEHKKKIKGTGQIRGVLCSTCNVFIGKSENNCMRYGISQKDLPSILRNTADYLEKDQYPYIHPSEAPKKKILSKNCFKRLARDYINKYPKRKRLVYPKSKHLTKDLEKKFKMFDIEIIYNK